MGWFNHHLVIYGSCYLEDLPKQRGVSIHPPPKSPRNKRTWRERGWCRLERFCRELSLQAQQLGWKDESLKVLVSTVCNHTWMSCWKLGSMVGKWIITYLLINGVYWGYNPLTNLLLTSWDIQVC